MGLLANGIRTEQRAPFAGSSDQDLIMDITVEGGQGLLDGDDEDKDVLLDVKVTDPTGTAALSKAYTKRAHAAEESARKNHSHYSEHYDHDRCVLVTLAVEVYGGACKELHAFIKSVAAFRASNSAGTWRKNSVIERLRKRLSIAVQSAVSAAVDASLRRSRPTTNYNAYKSVSLLALPASHVGTAEQAHAAQRAT